MILLSAYVENFGCLSDLHMDFTPGLNTVMRENGTGKTTLAAFLLAMLYGLPQLTVTSIEKNERKHYTPWQGGRFGGSITFRTDGGRRYRAVRYFGEKEKQDSFTLYDADTELLSYDYTAALGEELFGLSRSALEKSAFFRKTERDSFAASDEEIIARLSSYIEASSGVVTYDDAIKTLEKQRKVYIKMGNRGKIGELEQTIEEAKLRLLECKRDVEAKGKLCAERDRLRASLAANEQEEERINATVAALTRAEAEASLIRHAATLRNEKAEAVRIRTEYEASFGDALPSNDALLTLDAAAAAIEARASGKTALLLSPEEEKEAKAILDGFGGSIPDAEDENGMLRYTESEARIFPPLPDPPTAPTLPFPRTKILLSVILSAAFGIAGIFFLPLLLLVPIFGIAAILFFTAYRRKRLAADTAYERDNAAHREAILCRAHEEAEEKERRLNKAALARASYLHILDRASRTEAENDRIHREVEEEKKILLSRLAAFGEVGNDYRALLTSLRQRFEEYRALCEREKAAVRTLSQFLREHPELADKAKLTPQQSNGDRSVEALEREKQLLRETRSAMRASLDALERRILPLEESAKHIEEFSAVKAEAEEALRVANTNATAIERAERFLTEARDRLSSRYLGQMQESFSRHLSFFLPAWDSRGVLDSNLALKIENGGARYLPAYYSDGTRDILSLCMHLSLSEALIGDEKAPLLFDDNFADLDDGKLARVRAFLTEEAKTKQILYFTCHSSRCF